MCGGDGMGNVLHHVKGMGNCPGGINVPGNISGGNVRFPPEHGGDTSVQRTLLACHVRRSIST